jgi:hypothetical protein
MKDLLFDDVLLLFSLQQLRSVRSVDLDTGVQSHHPSRRVWISFLDCPRSSPDPIVILGPRSLPEDTREKDLVAWFETFGKMPVQTHGLRTLSRSQRRPRGEFISKRDGL